MSELTTAQRVGLVALLARCPTPMLAQVDAMAAGLPGLKAVALRRLAADEAQNRQRRDMVFAPLDPLFKPRADGLPGLHFPPEVRARLWAVAISHEPELLTRLDRGDQVSRTVADRLCLSAAMGVRDNPEMVWPEASLEQIEDLAGCLDLTPTLRRYLNHMECWLRGGTAASTADLKFAMKQVASVGPDGQLRMLEALFAHAIEARRFLRLLAQIVMPAREVYVTQANVSLFVRRLAEGAVARTRAIKAFAPASEEADITQFSAPLKWVSDTLKELDSGLGVRPDAVGSNALRQARHEVSGILSGHFSRAEQVVVELLPVESTVLVGKMKRPIPRLDQPMNEALIGEARALLGVVAISRGPAIIFGRDAERRQTAESLTWRLASWADEAIDRVNDGLVLDVDLACRRIGVAADLLAQIDAREAARSIRRRLMMINAREEQIRPATTGASPQFA